MVKVACIDSGVNAAHPHMGGVAGGIAIVGDDYTDTLGHGTAVAAAIREKVPEAKLYAVKVFDRALATTADNILRALEWCVAERMDVINLSLGTENQAHRERFARALEQVAAAGAVLVTAWGENLLPGSLPGVIAVGLDWDCPRDSYRYRDPIFLASGYPRPIPGVSPEKNLRGASFAVANMTGFVARARQSSPASSVLGIKKLLIRYTPAK